MAEYRHIGKKSERIAGRDFLTGKAVYARDMKKPRMLYGKVLRSPYAYAKIRSIDTAEAEKLPGVKAVLTYQNTPDWKLGMPFPHKRFLEDTVRFVGDAVAIVAAETEDIAEEATDLIKVEYEPMKPVLSIRDALAEDAPQLFPELPGNQVPTHVFEEIGYGYQQLHYGDVEKGFEEADVIVENTSHLESGQNPMPHEAPGVIAEWDGEDLVVSGSLSSAGLCKMMNAPLMGLPISGMRVIPACVGGSFGSKHISSCGGIIMYAAALSKVTKRPVALFYTKEEQMAAQSNRLRSEATYKIGLKKDGTVTALEGEWIADAGAFGAEQGLMIAVGLISVPINTNCKNVSLNTKLVVTNKMYTGAYRGYGYLENSTHICNTLYRGLEQINIDPLDYLRKTAIKPGDKLFHAYMMSGFIEAEGPSYLDCLEKAAAAFGWKDRWLGWGKHYIAEDGRIHAVGLGLAGMSDVGEQLSNNDVYLEFDGHVLINSGITEFGPGTRDVMRLIVAEEMNVPLDHVRLAPCDTQSNPYEWGSTGSRSTTAIGSTLQMAAKNAKKELFRRAAEVLHCPAEILDTKDGMVFIKDNPEAQIPWVAAIGFNGCITGVGNTQPYYNAQAYQAQFTEIAVDPETGKLEVLELVNAGDAGKIINPQALQGQFNGYFPGIDLVFREETIWDKDGRIVNPNMIDYRTRTFNELPYHYSIITENPPQNKDGRLPFGAIGAGEPSVAPGISALTMAIYNATGTWFNRYPITQADILAALNNK